MGFSFSIGHPLDVFDEEHGALVVAALHARCGEGLALGPRGEPVCSEELGWSWWKMLQERAADVLGEGAVPNLLGVDAWEGVYLDARMEPTRVWPDGEPEGGPEPPADPAEGRGVEEEEEVSIEGLLEAMKAEFGPRPGDAGALQVADLRGLRGELDALAAALGMEASEEAMSGLARAYHEDLARADEDGDIQCLCHAWVTATRALGAGAPMWLLK